MKFLNRHSLKSRVTLSTMAIFLVSLWSLSFYASYALRQDMQSELSAQQRATVALLSAQVEQRLSERLQWLQLVADEISASMLKDAQAVQAHLNNRPILRNEFNEAVLALGTDGQAIAELPGNGARVGHGWLDLQSVRSALQHGRAAIGVVFVDTRHGDPMFGMSAPVRDGTGRVIGALTGLTNLKRPNFLRIITDNRYGKTGGYLLIDPKLRRVITATDPTRIMEQLPVTGVNPALDRFIAGFEGSEIFVSPTGVEILASDKGVPITGWIVSAILPVAEAFAPIQRIQQHMMFATLLLTLLAGGLTWWLLRVQLVPVSRTIKTLTTLGHSGQPPQPVSVQVGGEIGQLVDAFNALLMRLAQREKALTHSQTMLARTETLAHIGSWEWDVKTNRVTWSSELFLIFGLPPEQSAPSLAEQARLYEPADFQKLTEAVQQAVSHGTPYVLELNARHHDGSQRICLARGQAQTDGSAQVQRLVGSLQDITELKLAQRTMQQNYSALQSVLQTTLDGFWCTDAKGYLRQVNPAYSALSGYTEAELLTLHISELDAIEHDADTQAHMARLLADGRDRFETRHRRKDGTLWDVEVNATVNPTGGGQVFAFLRDISQRKKAELELQMLASVFSHAYEGITISDATGCILNVNRAFCRITGYSREEAIGQNSRLLKSERQDPAFYDTMWHELTTVGHWSGEIWNRRKNGEVYAELLNISAVRDERGITRQYVGLFSDISARKVMEDRVRQLAFFDALTELPNRRLLADRLGQAMLVNHRSRHYGALMFLDLDNFKPLNDTHGHATGDLLLIEVARRLKACVRQVDTVARIGGDEFVVMLSELDTAAELSRQQAQVLAENVRQSIAGPFLLAIKHHGAVDTQVEHRCSASIGVAMFGPDDSNQERALKHADCAMYQAKDAGRNRVVFYQATP